jgi:hypothetical protein
MPLDDKEQRILDEIERQFYQDDPELARAVQRIQRPKRVGVRLSALGVFLGLVIIVLFITDTYIAAGGFLLLVVSATSLVHAMGSRGWRAVEPELLGDLEE